MALRNPFRADRVSEVELTEAVFSTVATSQIDKEAGIIRGVKIIGRTSPSRNRVYTDKAIAEACQHYEGVEVNINHPTGNKSAVRGLMEGWGVIRGPKPGTDGGFGDLHYLKSHPHTPHLLERIERGMPIGLSHNARGSGYTKNGQEIIESIPIVHSVDLVSRPGTVKNLFESAGDIITIRELIEASEAGTEFLAELTEMAIDPAIGDTPVEQPADGDNSLRSAVLAAISTKLETADAAAMKKVLSALGIEDSMTKNATGENGANGEQNKGAENKGSEKPITESALAEAIKAGVEAATKPLVEQLGTLQKQSAVRTLLESYNTSPAVVGAAKFKELCEAADEPAMKTLIEALPPAQRGFQKPPMGGAGGGNQSAKPMPRLINARR